MKFTTNWTLGWERPGRVLYYEGNPSEFSEVEPLTGRMKPVQTYNAQPIRFDPIFVYPSEDRPEVQALGLDNNELKVYSDLQLRSPSNRLLGLPIPVQGYDMEAECHAASGGLSKDPNEWKLLLQLAEDEEIGFVWGDAGMLYFWIREEDLANRNFDRVQVIAESC